LYFHTDKFFVSVCVPENANLFTIFTINYIVISKKDR